MQLTPHFTVEEAARTDHREYILPNINALQADAHAMQAAVALLSQFGESIRAHFGAPVILHSLYRMPALNRLVGGQPTSQHMFGEAMDFHVAGVELVTVFDWIRLESGFPFGQVILEGAPSWVHLSLGEPWRNVGRCREAFRAVPNSRGEMVYTRIS